MDLAQAAPQAGATGILFREPTAAALVEAVRRFERSEAAFRAETLRANALRFSRERCKAALRENLLSPRKEQSDAEARSPESPRRSSFP